jgi:hypothetical protein
MDRVTLDSSLSVQLSGASHPVPLYDPGGRTLGLFVPNKTLYANVKSPCSDEELERRERRGGGRSLAEMLADFELNYGRADG